MEAAQILDRVVARFIGTKHERDIKKLQPVIAAINAREAEVQSLSDEDLKTRFAELRKQVQEELKDADPAEKAYKDQLQNVLELVFVGFFGGIRVFQFFLNLFAQLGKARFEVFIAERLHFRFARVDGRDHGLQFLDIALVL